GRRGGGVGKLRKIPETVFGAEEIHEGAELHHLDDLALVNLADLRLRRYRLDAVDGGADRFGVGRGDLHRAVVGDVDLSPGLGHDLADHRAAGADNLSDLVDGDVDRLDARGIFAELWPRRVDGLVHLGKDVHAAVARLIERDLHDFLGDAGDLDVHLERGHALGGASPLEVHVAEMVLGAKDVGEHGESLSFLDEAHGDAGDRTFDRDTCVHHGERAAAHCGHRRGAIGLGDLRDEADSEGEALSVWQYRMDGAPGKLAVTDLAPARRAKAPDFADRIGREVVVEHKGFFVGALERIDILLVLAGAERGDGKRLRLSAGEQRAAMGARQNADLAFDWPHGLEIAAIDAP